MQTTTADTILNTSTTRFPDEIVFDILQFLKPLDIIRLRLVSKQFNGVTRDARLWRILYTNSRLPRPSGPFLWQSRQFLERTLIHSERISQTWTSEPIRIVSSLHGPRIPSNPSPVSTSFDFIFGRLFIWCEGNQILTQDVDTGIGRLLWEGCEPISSLDTCSLVLPDVCPSKLLEFPLQDDVRLTLGPVTFEMDLPAHANFPLSASDTFLCLNGGTDQIFAHLYKPVVIDLRTRSTYTFPVSSSASVSSTEYSLFYSVSAHTHG
ncbi:hypothetical protein JVU11DRAFT_6944 [Chiua virens]|nr:hypothetical protein JVU11DRAFT_6944 [Chiua virens]